MPTHRTADPDQAPDVGPQLHREDLRCRGQVAPDERRCAAGAIDLSRRWAQLALALLLLFFLAWDLRAVLADHRLTPTDSTTEEGVGLIDALTGGRGFWAGMAEMRKGPLAGLLVQLFGHLVGDLMIAARVLSVLLHGLLLWMVNQLARRLTGRRIAGLIAAALCGLTPALYGWFRLDFHEPLVAVAVVGVLWILVRGLKSARSAVALGMVAGLGILSKVSFPIFVVFPGLWFVATQIRDRKTLLRVLLAALVAALIISWWVIPNFGMLVSYAAMSTQRSEQSWLFKLECYSFTMRGVLPLMLGGLAGAMVAWRRRMMASWTIWLLLLGQLGGLALLSFVFDLWTRYEVPLLPIAALLAAVGLIGLFDGVAERWPHSRRPVLLLAALSGMSLVGHYCWLNLQVPDPTVERALLDGMVAPDRRPRTAYRDAVIFSRGLRAPGVLIMKQRDELACGPRHVITEAIWSDRGFAPALIPHAEAAAKLRQGHPVMLLICHLERAPRLDRLTVTERERREYRELGPTKPQLLRTFWDPGDLRYSVIKIAPRAARGAPRTKL